MIDIGVMTTARVTEDEMRQLLSDMRGVWFTGTGRARIDRPDAYVEVDYYPASEEIDKEEARSFYDRTGTTPASVIGIHWSGLRMNSRAVAETIARESVKRWGGEIGG